MTYPWCPDKPTVPDYNGWAKWDPEYKFCQRCGNLLVEVEENVRWDRKTGERIHDIIMQCREKPLNHAHDRFTAQIGVVTPHPE